MASPTALDVTEGIDLTGTTALVTGATSGLGLECARVLALRGARVIVPCRDLAKAAGLRAAMAEAHGAEVAARYTPLPCDLARMTSVRSFVAELAREGAVVDRLFLNAGIFNQPFTLTEEGFEQTAAANYLGHFLLLLDLVAAHALAGDARIVVTQSEGFLHPFAKVDLALLEHPAEHQASYSRSRASPVSKILLALASTELGRRAEGTRFAEVTMNGVCPKGAVTANMDQVGSFMRGLGKLFAPLVFHPIEVAAASLVWAATSPEVEGVSGKIFGSRFREMKAPAKCTDPVAAARAWDTSVRMLGVTDPFAAADP